MQEVKKPKKEIIEKLRMILDNPNIQDESIKNKYLIKLQKKLIKPSNINITQYKKEKEIKETYDLFKPSVIIHRKEKLPIFKEEKEIDEDLFKGEELYEIEKIKEDIPEFTEIKDEDKITKETPKEYHIYKEQKFETIDELPEWQTIEDESSREIIQKEEKESSQEIQEWEPITTEQFKEKKLKKKYKYVSESKNELYKNKLFKDIKSIDNKIAELLINNGYNSIDELKELTIKDFTKIKGIKRKIAKKIKKDIKKYFEYKENPEFEIIEEEISDDDFEKPEFNLKREKKIDQKKNRDNFFKYREYTLYRKEIKLQSDKKRIIHFFSKIKPDDGIKVKLPEGYEVKINKKTGVPYISRKK
jgi:hypothetical protein